MPTGPEEAFIAHLELIERIVASLCRRHGLAGDDADDLGSWLKMRLIEDDYALIRKFRGESSLATYLTVVISMMYREYRVHHWGRWRPSAAALRRGPVAVRLETLIHRDGCRPDQAVEIVASYESALSRRELANLAAELPPRPPLRPAPAGMAPLETVSSAERADARVAVDEAEQLRIAAEAALSAALATLSTEDRLVIRMRFWEGLSVAEIARGLHLPQKPLYRKIEQSLNVLRKALASSGISRGDVREMLGGSDI